MKTKLKILNVAGPLLDHAENLSPHQDGRDSIYHFRASEIGHCQNELVLNWRYRETGLRVAQSSVRLGFGTTWHDTIRNWMRAVNLKLKCVEEDMTFRLGDARITGHVDGAIERQRDRYLVPFDIKTTTEVTHRLHLAETPRPYAWQLQAYIHGLKKTMNVADYGLLLFVNIQQGDIQQVTVPYSLDTMGEIEDHLYRVIQARKKEKFGTREYNKWAFPCTYCEHRRPCWGLDSSVIRPQEIKRSYETLDAADQRRIVRALVSLDASDSSQKQSDTDKSRAHDRILRVLENLGVNRLVVPGFGDFHLRKNGLRIKRDT